MHRFFVPANAGQDPMGSVTLSPSDSRHALRVLRLQLGDEVEVLNGAGTCHVGRIAGSDRDGVPVEVLRSRQVPRPPEVILAPALLKGRAMDWLIQKATELGATEIQPLLTERTVVRVDPGEREKRIEDWRTTAIEACKQCGNPWLPRFGEPRGVAQFLGNRSPGLLLVAALAGEPRLPGQVLAAAGRFEGAVTIVIGPEGDLTGSELEQLEQAGAVPITLGPLVLRGETAAVASLAIVQHALRLRAS